MKNQLFKLFPLYITLIGLLLIWASCYGPFIQEVDQPTSAEPYDSVDVYMRVGFDPQLLSDPSKLEKYRKKLSNSRDTIGLPLLSICIPDGWSVEDSVPYLIWDSAGYCYHDIFVYDFMLSILCGSDYPAPEGYEWWVGMEKQSSNYITQQQHL